MANSPSFPLPTGRSFALAQTDLRAAIPLFCLGLAWGYALIYLTALLLAQVEATLWPIAFMLAGAGALWWERLAPLLAQDLSPLRRTMVYFAVLIIGTGLLQALLDTDENEGIILIGWACLPTFYRLTRLMRGALQTQPRPMAYWNGLILAGFSSPLLADWLGMEHALWVVPLCLGLGLLAVVRRREVAPSTPKLPASPASYSASDLLRQPYLVGLVSLAVIAWGVFWLLQALAMTRLAPQFEGDGLLLASFLGLGVGGLGIGLLVWEWRTLNAQPYSLGWQLSLQWGLLGLLLGGLVLALRGLDDSASSLGGIIVIWAVGLALQLRWYPTLQTRLTQPLRPAQQLLLREPLERDLYGATLLLAGALWLLIQQPSPDDLVNLAGASLLLTLVGAVLAWGLHRAYQRSLQQALERRHLNPQSLSNDPATLALLRSRLKSPHTGEAVYALELLLKLEGPAAQRHLVDLLSHPTAEVRQEALRRIESSQQAIAPTLLLILAESEDEAPNAREVALRLYARRATDPSAHSQLLPYLAHAQPAVQRGALVGLLEHATGEMLAQAERHLLGLTRSSEAEARSFAAQALGEVANKRFSSYLISLLNDSDARVQRAAIIAAGQRNDPHYWPLIVPQLGQSRLASAATTAIFLANKSVYPTLESVLNQPLPNNDLMLRIARICGRRRDLQALELLKGQFHYPDALVRSQVWISLGQCGYQAQSNAEIAQVEQALQAEAAYAAWLMVCLADLAPADLDDLEQALQNDFKAAQAHLILLLGFLHDPQQMRSLRYDLNATSAERRAQASKVLGSLLSQQQRRGLIPLLEDGPLTARLERLQREFPQPRLSAAQRLAALLESPPNRFPLWPRVLALHALPQATPTNASAIAQPYLESLEMILRETALLTLARLEGVQLTALLPSHFAQTQPTLARLAAQLNAGDAPMLLTLEKVLILKSIGIFTRLPDPILMEVATLLEELELATDEILFHEGDPGSAMYIIVTGKLRIMAGGKVIAERGERDFIGEMSLFDDEPRSASAQAARESKLLRLEQEAFMELMANHPDMALGVIRVLSARLRQNMQQKGISAIMADIYDKLTDLPDDPSYKSLSA
jgi:CRP-like cAMP-binding protein/HEAT repeat protein